jgi:hypothetical protein
MSFDLPKQLSESDVKHVDRVDSNDQQDDSSESESWFYTQLICINIICHKETAHEAKPKAQIVENFDSILGLVIKWLYVDYIPCPYNY